MICSITSVVVALSSLFLAVLTRRVCRELNELVAMKIHTLERNKELSDLLESEKQRADVNNDLLSQRVEEVEKLKKAYSRLKDATSLYTPDMFGISRCCGRYVVFGMYKKFPDITVPIKEFADTDIDYNLGLAEELKEKLEEKI